MMGGYHVRFPARTVGVIGRGEAPFSCWTQTRYLQFEKNEC